MVDLVLSEWERIWTKPRTRVLLVMVPCISIVTALFYQWNNQTLEPASRFYVSALSFPYMNFNVHLFLTLSFLIPLVAVDVFTGEVESGALRTVLLRPFERHQIFVAKLLALVSFLYVFLAAILIVSYPLGFLLLPYQPTVALFGMTAPAGWETTLLYTLRYYGYGSFTLLALMGIAVLVSVHSRSTISAAATVLGVWLFSLMLTRTPWSYLSIQELQTNELLRLLAGSWTSQAGFFSVVAGYLLLTLPAAGWNFTQRDC
ncbi:MAG: ABC transporter permease [Bacillota bacterium]